MQHILIQSLSRWEGREKCQRSFEEKGFSVHRKWQDRMVEFCGEGGSAELDHYWDEYAAEVVASAGKCHPDGRKLLPEPGYRSAYLDQMAAVSKLPREPFTAPPLLESVFEYEKKIACDSEFSRLETSRFESLKESEILRFKIFAEGWTGKKRDLVPFAKTYSEPRGFVARRNRFLKKTSDGLIFEFYVEAGKTPYLASKLPLTFLIYHMDDRDFVFNISWFNHIIPGFKWYTYFSSPLSCVLGLLAHIEMFDVMYHSFQAER
jgi:hypothetical protein